MGLRPHRPSDYPSTLLYVLDETHLTVTALTASVIVYTRSAHAAYFAIGALGSSLTAKVVKKLIRSPRPPPPPPSTPGEKTTHIRPKKTYGMPSTHSTALTFYVAYLVPLLLSFSHFSPAARWGMIIGLVGYWVGGVWSRVELGYHTYEQCLAGVALGSVLAVVWRGVWDRFPVIGQVGQEAVDRIWANSLGRAFP